jgi:hypothetical protein
MAAVAEVEEQPRRQWRLLMEELEELVELVET